MSKIISVYTFLSASIFGLASLTACGSSDTLDEPGSGGSSSGNGGNGGNGGSSSSSGSGGSGGSGGSSSGNGGTGGGGGSVSVPLTAKSVVTGENHTCTRLDNDTVKCWGANEKGQLGQGNLLQLGDMAGQMGDNLVAVDLGTGRTAKQIVAGGKHSCALLDNDAVKCWGANDAGQLGQGITTPLGDDPKEMGDDLSAIDLGTGRSAKTISAGKYHVCALLDNDTVKCWGRNIFGQLGTGNFAGVGAQPNQMGDNLGAIDLGTGRTAKSVATGGLHTCAILDDDTVKCWGSNSFGQLGQGTKTSIGTAAGQMGDNLSALDLGTGRSAKSLTAGALHTCALLDNDTVKCWGSGSQGKLGQGTSNPIGDEPNEMGDNLAAIDLGKGRTAKTVAAGTSQACAVLDNDTLKCWGGNFGGLLGQGTVDNVGDEPNEMGDSLGTTDLGTGRSAQRVGAGQSHTCALLDNDTLKCWGRNENGQLGQGSADTLGDEPNEMGDKLVAIDLGTQ